jgi:subtilisin
MTASNWKLSWHHQALKIADLWRQNVTGAGVTVALLDTGLSRPLGLDRTSFQYFDATGNAIPPSDSTGHGTCCASVIASYRGGALGVAPDVKVSSFRVVDTGNDAEEVETAFRHILNDRPDIDVLSCSFVIDQARPSLKDAVAALVADGRVVVAAAGDRNDAATDFPEQTLGAITVAAVNQQLQPLAGAKVGSWLDLSAPGKDIPAVAPGADRVVLFSESSAAAAVAAGVAALVLSTRAPGAARKQLASALEQLFKDTAVSPPGADPNAIGAGVTNPTEMVQRAIRNALTQGEQA